MSAANHPVDDSVLPATLMSIADRLVRQLAPLVPCVELDKSQVAEVQRSMSEAVHALANLHRWGPQNRIPSSHFWKIAGDILRLGRLQRHAREKPHGYAGDFEMLQMICEDDRFGTGIAWAFDDFFQRQPAPHAVRNRAQIVATRVARQLRRTSQGHMQIVSLGSGPAFDLYLLGKALAHTAEFTGRDVRLTLVDLDPRALEFAVERLSQFFPAASLCRQRTNLKRLADHPEVMQSIRSADFVSCPGFFDYLDRQEAVTMLGQLWRHMKPGSELLVFAFSEDNPSRAYMEWIGNWYLIHRNPTQMRQLAEQSGLTAGHYEVDAESSGVNLFIHARQAG